MESTRFFISKIPNSLHQSPCTFWKYLCRAMESIANFMLYLILNPVSFIDEKVYALGDNHDLILGAMSEKAVDDLAI